MKDGIIGSSSSGDSGIINNAKDFVFGSTGYGESSIGELDYHSSSESSSTSSDISRNLFIGGSRISDAGSSDSDHHAHGHGSSSGSSSGDSSGSSSGSGSGSGSTTSVGGWFNGWWGGDGNYVHDVIY